MAVRTLCSIGFAALVATAAGPACTSDSGDDDDGSADDGGDQGDDTGDGSDDGDDDGADDGGDAPGGGSLIVEWGPVTVPAGQENTMCVRKRLPTDRPVRVGQIINQLGLASHHMIVYRLADGEETVEPEECTPFVEVLDPSRGAPMAVSQKAEETISLPPGVAFTLEPGQLIRVELHFVNASDQPQELRATTTFVEVPEDEFEQEADFLFIGNPDVDVPAHSTATLGPSFLPMPSELAGSQIFAITGHEHQWGTDVRVELVTDPALDGVSIYELENFKWDEPETVYHDPPIVVPDGGGFRFTCEWNNTGNADVGFGESVDDEMCFFWAYYYPSQGAKVCFHTDMFGGENGINLCCPSPTDQDLCNLIDDFLDNL